MCAQGECDGSPRSWCPGAFGAYQPDLVSPYTLYCLKDPLALHSSPPGHQSEGWIAECKGGGDLDAKAYDSQAKHKA
jgi:hypothetical protein